ncbi:hypothetical protein M1349_01610 [Patescibacteria group bacterium]|nr:hypothetical protein [Patescibacteria group bacterium]
MISEAKSLVLSLEMSKLMATKEKPPSNHLESILQAAPNPTIETYVYHVNGCSYFVKRYQANFKKAFEEINNFQHLEAADFVPNLSYVSCMPERDSAIFAYELIDGIDMHRQFDENLDDEQKISLSSQAVRQFYEMGHLYDSPKHTTSPWPLKSPIRTGFLSEEEERSFLENYEVVFNINRQALQEFPGFYFDRNPRNVINSNGKIYQVDFNAVEYSSPLFDIAKFLRNGRDTGIPANMSLKTRKDYSGAAKASSAFTPEEEKDLLSIAYSLQNPGEFDSQKFERFSLYFKFATVHTHIFYLTKYLNMLRRNVGDSNALRSRSIYHHGMLLVLSDEIGELGFELNPLMQHIDSFIQK